MVTFKIYTFVYLNVDYHFFGREWNDSQFQNIRRGVKVMKFWIVCPLKTLNVGRSKHFKNSSKILANTFSDSPAILNNFFAGWRRQIFFHRKFPGSLPVPITVSELWECLFPFPSHNSLRGRTPLVISPNLWLFSQYCLSRSRDLSLFSHCIYIPDGILKSNTLEGATFRVKYQSDLNPTGKIQKARVMKFHSSFPFISVHVCLFESRVFIENW